MKGALPMALLAGACGARSTGIGDDDTDVDSGTQPSIDAAPPCDGVDTDGDGFVSLRCGGDDCDDSDPLVHPGAEDEWTSEAMPGDPDYFGTSFALDAAGAPHLSWLQGTSDLYYASRNSDAWTYYGIRVRTDNHGWPVLSFDGAGEPHVVFPLSTWKSESGFDIWHAKKGPGPDAAESWVQTRLGPAALPEPDIYLSSAVDREGHIHVVSGDRYFTDVSGKVVVEPLEEVAVNGTMAVDAAGTPSVAYWAYPKGSLRFATRASGSWEVEEVDARRGAGYSDAVLILAEDGSPHVLYRSGTTVQHAVREGDAWTVESSALALDARGLGGRDRITLDAAGAVHLCTFVGPSRYATNRSGDWIVREFTDSCLGLAIGPDDRVRIAAASLSERHYLSGPIPDGIDQDCDGEAF